MVHKVAIDFDRLAWIRAPRHWIVAGGPILFLRFLPATMIVTGSLIAFACFLRFRIELRTAVTFFLGLALLLGGAGAIGFRSRFSRSFVLQATIDNHEHLFLVLLLTAHLAVLGTLPIALIAIFPSSAFSDPNNFSYAFFAHGFYDKRWLYFTYCFYIILLPIFPGLVVRTLHFRQLELLDQKQSRHISTNALNARLASDKTRLLVGFFIKFLFAILVAIYLWEPPWNINNLSYPVDFDAHQTVHLGALLAMHQGRIPYTEAISQYGPGSQLLIYWYMANTDFSIIKFNEAYALIGFIGGLSFCMICLFSQKIWVALLAIFFALSFSSFNIGFTKAIDGSVKFSQFAGWNMSLRYIGVLFLGVAIPRTLLLFSDGRKSAGPVAFIIGLIWGLSIYIAQENFSGGLIVIALMSILSLLTRTVEAIQLLSFLMCQLGGVCVALVPIFAYYFYVGQLHELFHIYFYLSELVPQGLTTTPWSLAYNGFRLTGTYYGTALIFCTLIIGVLYWRGQVGLVTRLRLKRLEFVGILYSAIALFQGALFRSDATHLIASSSGVPLLAALTIERWPHFYYQLRHKKGRKNANLSQYSKYRFVVALVLLLIFPFFPSKDSIRALIAGAQFNRFVSYEGLFAKPLRTSAHGEVSVTIRRFGFWPRMDQPCVPWSKVACERLISEMTAIRAIIKNRPTIIHRLPDIHDSAVYFFADLVVGTRFTSKDNSVMTSRDFEEWLSEIGSLGRGCLITDSADSREAKVFIATSIETHSYKRELDAQYLILCHG